MEDLTIHEKIELMSALEKVVREAGEQILNQRGTRISDTGTYKGHEASTIDEYGREKVQAALEHHLPHFEGIIRFELRPIEKTLIEKEEHHPLVLIIDEIEGTTNTKRCLASSLEYRPPALVSIALSLSKSLRDLIIGVVYTLDQGEIFSAMRVDATNFLSFHNGKLISPEEIIYTQGDSQKRVLVIGYSNSHRKQKGELEQLLYNKKLRIYEGCRSSGMDTINIIRNCNDAYIDCRHFWSTKNEKGEEKEAMLEIYDVAGVIPIAVGCGLKVTDAEGRDWRDYAIDDTIPLIISRPDIYQIILDTIAPLLVKWKKGIQKG